MSLRGYFSILIEDMDIRKLTGDYFDKKGLPLRPALTFADVTIVTKFSEVVKRSDLNNFKTHLSKNFTINLPITSANMGDVTGPCMAIALARLGALGFLPQFGSIEDRVDAVRQVKRVDNERIDEPLTVSHSAKLGDAWKLMRKHGVSSVLVVDSKKNLKGILTSRDYRFRSEKDSSLPIKSVMTSKDIITGGSNISMDGAMKLFEKYKIEKLPLVDKSGKVSGLISAKDVEKRKQYPNAVRDKNGRLAVGAGLRLTGDYVKEAADLLEVGTDVLLLDTARAGAEIVVDATKKIRKKFPAATLVVGNIDNPEHVRLLADAGADCVKVGIGPGARCKTRLVAGVGTPQLHAIASCVSAAKAAGIYVIGDGGIKGSDDFSKALVAGADSVMIGSLLAGTDEAPGILMRKGNQLWKQYRGSASLDHQLERIQKGSLDEIRNPEGEAALVAYAGSVDSVIKGLIDGLKSSMSYTGARTIKEFHEKGEFLWVSNSGYEEGKPRT